MKTTIFLILLSLIFTLHAYPQKKAKQSKNKAEITQVNDSVEYELLVFDAGFETYLAKLPYSKDFHTNDYYKNWNIRYVTEWNTRAINPIKYGDLYENQLDYRNDIDYGLELNFRLYHYFQYFEQENGINLIKRK
jgi:hypothetical protein